MSANEAYMLARSCILHEETHNTGQASSDYISHWGEMLPHPHPLKRALARLPTSTLLCLPSRSEPSLFPFAKIQQPPSDTDASRNTLYNPSQQKAPRCVQKA